MPHLTVRNAALIALWTSAFVPNTAGAQNHGVLHPGKVWSVAPAGGSRVFFLVWDGWFSKPGELWITDGTKTNTSKLSTLYQPSLGKAFGSKFLFFGDAGKTGSEPHVTDGTVAGTKLLRDIRSGSTRGYWNGSSTGGSPSAVLNGRVYFNAADDTHGGEIWVTDGTTAGTRFFVELEPGSAGSRIWWLSADPNRTGCLLCIARSSRSGGKVALWSIDTAAKAKLLVNFGTTWFPLEPPMYFGGRLTLTFGRIVITNGTAAGTTWIGTNSARQLGVMGNRLVFHENTAALGRELWTSDGTAAGTKLLKDLSPGPLWGVAGPTLAVGGKYYFLGTTTGRQFDYSVYVTDGTAANTIPLHPLVSADNVMMPLGSEVLFTGVDPLLGYREIFVTNGTVGGTRLVHDATPGPNRSYTKKMLLVKGDLYYINLATNWSLSVAKNIGKTSPFVGVPCGPTNPVLQPVGRPLLGQSWSLLGKNSVPNRISVLVAGLRPRKPTMYFGCLAYVDLSLFAVLATYPTTNWTFRATIPNNPSLYGVEFACQSWMLGLNVSIHATNGVFASIGK